MKKCKLIFEKCPMEKSMKIENFEISIFRKNQNFEIWNFHWLFHRIFFENKFALFHEKLPFLKICISELRDRIPFKFGLKSPQKQTLGGKTFLFN